jgi:NAD(P)-dependent dehydrogenase (short-subunit alcohol dehydrogenase family)
VAKQHGKAIFNMSVSFQAPEEGLEHQLVMPRIGETMAVLDAPQLDITSGTAKFGSQHAPNGLRELSPIYCATKAALHSYTLALRQQLKDHGVEVIELMPPAVHTDLTADLPDDGDFKIITTEQLMAETFKGLRAGREEIRPGQANQLYWMSRIAPGFINAQLEKGSKALVPPPEQA